MMRLKITPQFSVKEIIDQSIGKDWYLLQDQAFDMGKKLTSYMQNYINSHRKRSGGTGNLAKQIKFYGKAGAGLGKIEWGIGRIATLNRSARYWYVLNFGKMVTGQRFTPPATTGSFEGQAPDSSLIGKGTQRLVRDNKFYINPKAPIRPINYIQATQAKMGQELGRLLAKLRRGQL